MSKLRPILFSTAMVQAILEGRKTQTRRVVKGPVMKLDYVIATTVPCPYGQPGDVLWVRETWAHTSQLNLNPEDDNYGFVYKADGQDWKDFEGWTWKSSIHMPFAAARIFLRVKSVRVERLQDISETDAIAEGIKSRVNRQVNQFSNIYATTDEDITKAFVTIQSFCSLWQSINGSESWDANPWVWVVEFERITREEALNV